MKRTRFRSNFLMRSISFSALGFFLLSFPASKFVFAESGMRIIEFSEFGESQDPISENSAIEEKEPASKESENAQAASVSETELPSASRLCGKILPDEVMKAAVEDFSPEIRRSYEPGCVLESVHFWVEADSFWKRNAPELAASVQSLERICREAELTAALWRSPIPNAGQSGTSPQSAASFLAAAYDFSGKRIRLRVAVPTTDGSGSETHSRSKPDRALGPNSSSAGLTGSCRFEIFEEGPMLTLELSDFSLLQESEWNQQIRRAVFRSVLHDGNESLLFPVWLQDGLEMVFAGIPSPSEKDLPLVSFLPQLPVHSQEFQAMNAALQDSALQDSAALWVRYFLTSDDARNFFPFWNALGQAYRDANEEWTQTQNAGAEKPFSPPASSRWSGTSSRNQGTQSDSELDFSDEIQSRLEFFARKLESQTQNETFAGWRKAPDSGQVRVFWRPEAEVLNAPVRENQPVPTLVLPDSRKKQLLEMAQVLKIANQYQTVSSSNSGTETHGIRIYEFENPRKFHQISAASEVTAPDETETADAETADAEMTDAVTADDLQRLEDVYAWFARGSNPRQTLGVDGTILSAALAPRQVETLFHPKDRAYLLQDYGGNPVLSATFEDGSVLHAILEKNGNASRVPKVRVLGVETPDPDAVEADEISRQEN